ncbi:N-acetylneuraminate lyase [Abditibacteriota bacterium]|nr:N-acetylneuraminate lyase [Abditibacteriota bacterium]
MNQTPLRGLVAATHTPFDAQGQLKLGSIEAQAAHLVKNGVRMVFIGGSTGESPMLTLDERLRLADRWRDIASSAEIEVIVHVGGNCLEDARTLAKQAGKLGARAISMVAPSYFKPASLDLLVACCVQVAKEAPETPFYYYDIPALTGVKFSMPDFMQRATEAIPTFAGLKYTNFDLGEFQLCRSVSLGHEVFWGVDEFYLAAMTLGASGAIGSTFNFAAPIARRMEEAFGRSDLESARREQLRIVQLVQTLVPYGYLPAAKATMKMLGVDLGAARLPFAQLGDEQKKALRADLEKLGFFEWIA